MPRDEWDSTIDPHPTEPLLARVHIIQSQLKRGGKAALYLLAALLGLLLFIPLFLILSVGLLTGHAALGWVLLAFTLLALVGLWWTAQRVRRALKTPPSPAPAGSSDEQALRQLLRQQGRNLPAALRPAFQATVLSTRDALRARASEGLLSREAYDAQQAAQLELPELVQQYQALPPSTDADAQFLEQLRLIQERMEKVAVQGRQQAERTRQAQRRYLEGKYGDEDG